MMRDDDVWLTLLDQFGYLTDQILALNQDVVVVLEKVDFLDSHESTRFSNLVPLLSDDLLHFVVHRVDFGGGLRSHAVALDQLGPVRAHPVCHHRRHDAIAGGGVVRHGTASVVEGVSRMPSHQQDRQVVGHQASPRVKQTPSEPG